MFYYEAFVYQHNCNWSSLYGLFLLLLKTIKILPLICTFIHACVCVINTALQCESVRKIQSDRIDLSTRMRDMEQKLQHERQDHRDLIPKLKVKACLYAFVYLALCQEELRKEKREREKMEQDNDATISDLLHKLDNMETHYEKVLHDTLDSLSSQLSVARQRWEDNSTALHQNYKGLLSEFGLNALDI
uniref:Dynein regulatory complex protein 12 n=1 Tax=Seriola lalandi dorsalis TaxID=1841481 RepID=A0A3B4XF87_SERLL